MVNMKLSGSFIRQGTKLYGSATTTQKPGVMTRVLVSKPLGKLCDIAADNPVMCQSIYSLGICCLARPATNILTTPDKKDAAYANGQSFSSGIVGISWPVFTAVPLAAAVGLVLKQPQKFLKPELIKKFYPNVGIKEVIEKGKKSLQVMTNTKGEMLRQDGSVLCRNLEPLKPVKNGDTNELLQKVNEQLKKTSPNKTKKIEKLNQEKLELEEKLKIFNMEKEEFEAANPKLYIDDNGIARSREVFKTENGKFILDKKGNKVGCAVQKTTKEPITEEMEVGIQKEQNIKNIINFIPDTLLAVPRAFLTIECIPWLLKNVFHVEKPQKNKQPNPSITTNKNNKVMKGAA